MRCAALPACSRAARSDPNFKAPQAPHDARFAPAGQLPAATAAAALPGGEAQRFVDGLDIPGQWWTLFKSAQLNALIERALKNSPTLEAAQAALRQANENTRRAARQLLSERLRPRSRAQRQKASGAAFGIPGFPSSYFYNLDTASVNVSYTLDAFGGIRRQVEASQAQAEYQQFALRSQLSHPDVEHRDRAPSTRPRCARKSRRRNRSRNRSRRNSTS